MELLDCLRTAGGTHTVRAVGDDLVLVTTVVDEEAGEMLFRKGPDGYHLEDADTLLLPSLRFDLKSFVDLACSPAPDNDHRLVIDYASGLAGNFSTRNGPDGGNLACVWAVRHIIRECLGRWITKTDSTRTFFTELSACMEPSGHPDGLPAGSIVISPTDGPRIGHVGLLGEGTGDSRPVYSNSSRKAMWVQNYTVGRWLAYYSGTKGLRTEFFRLPNHQP